MKKVEERCWKLKPFHIIIKCATPLQKWCSIKGLSLILIKLSCLKYLQNVIILVFSQDQLSFKFTVWMHTTFCCFSYMITMRRNKESFTEIKCNYNTWKIKLLERIKVCHSISHMFSIMEVFSALDRRMMIYQQLHSQFAKAVLYRHCVCPKYDVQKKVRQRRTRILTDTISSALL